MSMLSLTAVGFVFPASSAKRARNRLSLLSGAIARTTITASAGGQLSHHTYFVDRASGIQGALDTISQRAVYTPTTSDPDTHSTAYSYSARLRRAAVSRCLRSRRVDTTRFIHRCNTFKFAMVGRPPPNAPSTCWPAEWKGESPGILGIRSETEGCVRALSHPAFNPAISRT